MPCANAHWVNTHLAFCANAKHLFTLISKMFGDINKTTCWFNQIFSGSWKFKLYSWLPDCLSVASRHQSSKWWRASTSFPSEILSVSIHQTPNTHRTDHSSLNQRISSLLTIIWWFWCQCGGDFNRNFWI